MLRKLLLTIGAFLTLVCWESANTTMATAQCDCGNCGDSEYVVNGEYGDDGGATFERNIGNGQPNRYPGCGDGSCPQVCCPAVKCGPYISVFGGWSTIDNFTRLEPRQLTTQIIVDPNPPPPPAQPAADLFVTTALEEDRSFQLDSGVAWGVAIGRQVHARGRVELEGSYRENNFESFRVEQFEDTFTSTDPNADPVFDNLVLTNSLTDPAVGRIQSYSIMGNFLYDFSPRCLGRYSLYGGGGIGAIYITGNATTATRVYDVNDSTFAYQIIGGVTRTMTRRIDLFLDYRYMSASSISIDELTTSTSLGSFDFATNNFFIGLRLRR